MNKFEIKTNSSHCCIIDDQGNININTNSNEQLEKLLLKQNELKKLNTNIEEYKKELKKNKSQSIQAEIINGFTYSLDIIFFISGLSNLPFHILLAFILISHSLLKYVNIKNYGTKIARGHERHTLENILKKLEEQVSTIEKQINEIKNNYNSVNINERKVLPNEKIIAYQDLFENAIEEKPKTLVKVHRKKNE